MINEERTGTIPVLIFVGISWAKSFHNYENLRTFMRKILSDVQNEEGKKCLVNTGKNEETLMVPKEKALSGFWCRWRDLNPRKNTVYQENLSIVGKNVGRRLYFSFM